MKAEKPSNLSESHLPTLQHSSLHTHRSAPQSWESKEKRSQVGKKAQNKYVLPAMALPCLCVNGSRYSWHIAVHVASIGRRVSLVCMPMFSVPPSGLPCVRGKYPSVQWVLQGGDVLWALAETPSWGHPESGPSTQGWMEGWVDGQLCAHLQESHEHRGLMDMSIRAGSKLPKAAEHGVYPHGWRP